MKAWEAFLSNLETKLGRDVVDKWLRSLKVVDFDACNLYLDAKDSFQIDWFNEHIRKLCEKSLRNENHHLIKVHFKNEKKKIRKKAEPPPPKPFIIETDSIDPNCTFGSFITGPDNQFVVDFLKQLKPGSYNPIFLHGPEGCGKTHLTMAVATLLEKQNLSVAYVHAETFTQHVVSAIRASQMQDFRTLYRNKDVLIIDDIHHLARRAATQEELFHTFNTLHTSSRQIILTSHLPTSLLTEIEPRLISRFEWGILLKLEPLPTTQMRQVIKAQANANQFPVSEPLIDFLIETFGHTSKSLLVAFEALLMRHRYPNAPTPSDAKHLLKDLIAKQEKTQLTPEKITLTTAAYFGMRYEDILGKSQTKECVMPRKIAMYLCREKLHIAYPALGRFFKRDHSTVMSSIKQIEKKRSLAEIAIALEEIEGTFTNAKIPSQNSLEIKS